jgi:hypothetical protein
MAFTRTIYTNTGITVQNSYSKVELLSLIGKDVINFSVRNYAESPQGRDVQLPYFSEEKNFRCDYDINGENPIKQAYVYLKTLPEFEGVSDV